MRLTRTWLMLWLTGVLLIGLALPAAAGAVSAATAIGHLNQQRRANGIPAGIAVKGRLSRACRKHNHWMAIHHVLAHFENKGTRGYSRAGDLAGQHSVLGYAIPPIHWSSVHANPWESAPVHLSQLLDPLLEVSGYNESESFECAQTLATPRRVGPTDPRLYTYPGPGSVIYRGERAAESPFTPGQLVGIPQGQLTGPYIYLLISARSYAGPQYPSREAAHIVSGSLRQVGGGSVPLAIVDTAKPVLQPYVPPGGYMIPRHALKAGKRYEAKVKIRFRGEILRRTWRFRANSGTVG